MEESYSISAGLDFPSVGPQHAYLQSISRRIPKITDDEALNAFQALANMKELFLLKVLMHWRMP